MSGVFQHSIRVGWGNCDPAGIAYTGWLPMFALQSIDAWWADRLGAGWYEMEFDHGFGTPFVSMRLDFSSPVTPRHPLVCEVAPVRLGRTSITFRVVGRQDGVDRFSGSFTSVFVTHGGLEKREPPGHVRDLVEREIAGNP